MLHIEPPVLQVQIARSVNWQRTRVDAAEDDLPSLLSGRPTKILYYSTVLVVSFKSRFDSPGIYDLVRRRYSE
jgi:hypothetical protein